ncbi:P-loop containing nucleoside triphosphate hydrolase protein [Mycena vulgaris]|nr:P-loop containing nucleoside triphosphate hydrolase protein [Mycena vulgaris]
MSELTLILLASIATLSWALYAGSPIESLTSFVQEMVSNPQIAELFRFIFLGTILETGRKIGQALLDFGINVFLVKAEFTTGDFAYDWVLNYMEHQRVWNKSRSFKVVARNAASRPSHGSSLGMADGNPDPIYEPAELTPSFFRWEGHWIMVTKTVAGYSHYDTGEEKGGKLVISLLMSRNRELLEKFVRSAREFYINSNVLPRRVTRDEEPSGVLLTAHFIQADLSYDWMLGYLRSSSALSNASEFTISTKQSDLRWGTGTKDSVRYIPTDEKKQQFLFTSPTTGKSTWLQVVIEPGHVSYVTDKMVGGSIEITLHTSDKNVLADLIQCAHQKYLEDGISSVSVHITDNRGDWAKTITKSRRALSTLILPSDIKEMLLADAKEFLESEDWYNTAGIPHRRGYLLYGEPGTGKSSTIHALAGELGLEIYFISLASPGIDDHSLGKLISDTPSRCILLLEDIDCAFPSREDEEGEDEELILDKDGKPLRQDQNPPRSEVTLSGLLNVLDSVSSEEGRLTFATTNHIENLDPALIRAGRMDVKIQYKFADSLQIEQVFKRFYPLPDETAAGEDVKLGSQFPSYNESELDGYAAAFARDVPAGTYSIAQIQGYLLTKKRNPGGAAEGVLAWLESQEEEKRTLAELKQKKKADRARRLKLAQEKAEPSALSPILGGSGEQTIAETTLETSDAGNI